MGAVYFLVRLHREPPKRQHPTHAIACNSDILVDAVKASASEHRNKDCIIYHTSPSACRTHRLFQQGPHHVHKTHPSPRVQDRRTRSVQCPVRSLKRKPALQASTQGPITFIIIKHIHASKTSTPCQVSRVKLKLKLKPARSKLQHRVQSRSCAHTRDTRTRNKTLTPPCIGHALRTRVYDGSRHRCAIGVVQSECTVSASTG